MAAKSTRSLSRWALLMAGETGPILAGCEGFSIRRTSTPLVSFDPETGTGLTSTGRPYQLHGDPEPGYALSAFHSLWDAGDVEIKVVSPEEAVAIIKKKGNEPFRHSAEEQADLDEQKIRHLSVQASAHIVSRGLDETEAARRAGLSADEFKALLAADPSGISADRADQAFVRMVGIDSGGIRDGDEKEQAPAPAVFDDDF